MTSTPFEIQVSIPTAEIRAGILSSHTEYQIDIVDFGCKTTIAHRFDDFVKLSETLSDFGCPSLPAKAFFGGNDPKTVEERRPQLEAFLRFCVESPKVLTEPTSAIFSFLGLSDGCKAVVSALTSTLDESVLKSLINLTKSPKEFKRLCNEKFVNCLVSALEDNSYDTETCSSNASTPPEHQKTIPPSLLTLLQFIAEKPAGRKALITGNILSALLRVSANISNFRNLLETFYYADDWPTLFKTENFFLQTVKDFPHLHAHVARFVWFGLAEKSRSSFNSDLLPVLGRLFVSEGGAEIKIIAVLSLGLLVEWGIIEEEKIGRVCESVSELHAEIESDDDFIFSCVFLGNLFKGSAGLSKIAFLIDSGKPEISNFAVLIFSLTPPVPAAALARAGVTCALENYFARLKNQDPSADSRAVSLLLRLRCEGQLPTPRQEAPRLEEAIRDGIARTIDRFTQKLNAAVETGKKEQSLVVSESTRKNVEFSWFYEQSLADFSQALSRREISLKVINRKIGQVAGFLQTAEEEVSDNNSLSLPDLHQLANWAETASAVASMENEVLQLVQEIFETNDIINEFV